MNIEFSLCVRARARALRRLEVKQAVWDICSVHKNRDLGKGSCEMYGVLMRDESYSIRVKGLVLRGREITKIPVRW